MLNDRTRASLRALVSGLLLAACGDAPEAGPGPAEERLDTRESALCAGTSVTTLTVDDVTTYDGVTAGGGDWAVASPANAVRLEYYVDGVLRSYEERTGTSGRWYFSTTGLACGSHGFVVKAWPMVTDSANNRTTCVDSPRSESKGIPDHCPPPPPTASFSCARVSSTLITCTGSSDSGITPLWQDYHTPADSSPIMIGWYESTWTQDYTCASPTTSTVELLQVRFKVRDGNGLESAVHESETFSCRPNSVLYRSY